MSSDAEERIEALEARVAELEHGFVDNEMANLRGRLDDLRVQASLARLDGRDDVKAILDRLDTIWTETRQQLERLRDESVSAGRGVTESVRGSVRDLRSAFEDATSSIRGSGRD
jgi:polyhydroxyalkanoate synthesis regulator phasin